MTAKDKSIYLRCPYKKLASNTYRLYVHTPQEQLAKSLA